MDDLMLTSTIKLTAWPGLLQAWQVPSSTDPASPTLMLLESMPSHKVPLDKRQDLLQFVLYRPGINIDVATYRSGRIFHEYGELRWESLNTNEIRVVYTGTPDYQLNLPESQSRAFNDRISMKLSRTYLLFGKRLGQNELNAIGSAEPGDFAEVRIPRLLRYPALGALAEAERIQIAVYTYVDRATGAHIAYRFHGLEKFRGEEKAPQ